MGKYEPVIGLEVHCELATKTKLWCSCPNEFGREPNTNICEVCLGLPGTLPVLNEEALRLAIKFGLAVNSEIRTCIFHRKNYFYPDMPKNFQISQYDRPINVGGKIELDSGKVINLVRAHLEEDTGKISHASEGGRIRGSRASLIDYNRAGVPLLEIVSEPEISSPEEAKEYVVELRDILTATKISDAKMEESSLRIDANVSLRKRGVKSLGTRCEIKNLNSLRSLVRALEVEIKRQSEILDSGEEVVQETRHFDENKNITYTLRSKEEAHDYRYFPEPDLVEVAPGEQLITEIKEKLEKIPSKVREIVRGLVPEVDNKTLRAITSNNLSDFFFEAISFGADPSLSLKRIANELLSNPEGIKNITTKSFSELISLEESNSLTSTQARLVLIRILETAEPLEEAIKNLGFDQSDVKQVTENAVELAIEANPKEWQRFLDGDAKMAQFLVGQVMKMSKGKADGKLASDLFNKRKI